MYVPYVAHTVCMFHMQPILCVCCDYFTVVLSVSVVTSSSGPMVAEVKEVSEESYIGGLVWS